MWWEMTKFQMHIGRGSSAAGGMPGLSMGSAIRSIGDRRVRCLVDELDCLDLRSSSSSSRGHRCGCLKTRAAMALPSRGSFSNSCLARLYQPVASPVAGW